MPSDTHAESRRKRLFAAYIRSACPGRQAQRKMGARCALILGLAERVGSFATTSFPARTLFFMFTSFHTVAFIRLIRFAHSLRKLAHPVHLKMHRCVIPLSPPQKKSRSGSFSVAERVGFEPTKPFMGAYTISSRARSTGLRHLSNFGCLSIIHYFTPIVKRLS